MSKSLRQLKLDQALGISRINVNQLARVHHDKLKSPLEARGVQDINPHPHRQETKDLGTMGPTKGNCGLRVARICFTCGETSHLFRKCPITTGQTKGPPRKKVCCSCGGEGHQSSHCPSNCPNYEEDHPPGNCPTSNATCYLCESPDHVPAKCPMDFVVTSFSKIQKGSFQLAVQTSRDKGIKKSRLPQDNPNPRRQEPTNSKNKKRYRPNVSCYECGEVGHYSMDCPKRKQLLSTDKAPGKNSKDVQRSRHPGTGSSPISN